MENQNVTIEDLAIMIKQGFDETDRRFDKVDERFNTIDVRFDIVEGRLERIEKLLLDDHRRRIEKLEYEIKELKGLLNVG